MSDQETLSQYLLQLSSVQESLKTAVEGTATELNDLKNKLTEVVSLLQACQDSCKNVLGDQVVDFCNESKSTDPVQDDDDEFSKFQREISELENDTTKGSIEDDSEKAHAELCQLLRSMEGNKCRAPFLSPWGQRGYHNGIIFAIELPDDCEDTEDVTVKVMFSNPICENMKPCPYFLDGHCKFPDSKCRYSHGCIVKYADLEEYISPDYTLLTRDAHCLAKCDDSNGIWHSAVVENCLSNQRYCIKLTSTGVSHTLDSQYVLPLGNVSISDDDDDSSSSDSSEDFADKNDVLPATSSTTEINYVAEVGSSPLGSWEKHTNGIGSKLMAKMGYVWGQGLGKNSDGRIEPIEAIVLPKGKSLDRCVELRESKGPESVEDLFNAEQAKELQRVKKIEKRSEDNESSVFSFLNKNLSSRGDCSTSKKQNLKRQCDGESNGVPSKLQSTDLNFEMYSVGEAIMKTRKEIGKLQQSLKRNSERNEATHSVMKQKMAVQTNLLQQLVAKEKNISNQINMKKNHKKITMF